MRWNVSSQGYRRAGLTTDPSACISALNPLLDTAEGRKFLSKQEGEKALVLIELFDWVAISLFLTLFPRGLKTWFSGFEISWNSSLNKGCVLWTLRQLCACLETLPSPASSRLSSSLPIRYHAAGGFADVWKGTYDGREVAFKSIRGSTLSDDAARLKRKVRYDVFPPTGHS
jgi:hypothetical protein